MSEGKIEAVLSLRREGRPMVGRDRIELLEAVDVHGTITKAAQAVGLSYKAAWDALNAVNNLLPRPAVVAQTGGKRGGGAMVTEDGKALIAAFRLIEERLSRIADSVAGGDGGRLDPLSLLWSLGMKFSSRNVFRCRVEAIRQGAVNAEVTARLSDSSTLSAVVTAESLHDLGIRVGREVVALVKSSFVMIASGSEPLRVSARNRIAGTIARREDGPVSTEFILDIGDGKSLAAVVTRDAADELGLKPGDAATAFFKASHVVLAVD